MTASGGSGLLPTEEREAHLLDYWSVVLRRRRAILLVTLAVLTLASLHALLASPIFRGTAQILIERDNPNVLAFKEVAEIDAAKDDYYQTQYKLLQSRGLARQTLAKLELLKEREYGGPRTPEEIAKILAAPDGASPELEQAIDRFLKNLLVEPVKSSRLVTVSFDSPSPRLAAEGANQHSRFYIEQSLKFRYDTSSDAVQWLNDQITLQRAHVEQEQQALDQLKEKQNIVNIDERRALLDQRIKDLGATLTGLKATTLERQALHHHMAGTLRAEELPEVQRDPIVQSLLMSLTELERQKAKLLDVYLDEHPEVVKLGSQIAETRRKIAQEAQRVIRAAENDYKSASAQESSLTIGLEAAKTELIDLGRRGAEYDSRKREVDASRAVLDSLMSRAKQTGVSQDLKTSNIRVVDAATAPMEPVRPRRVLEIFLGLVLGLTLGVCLGFFLDYMDATIKTPEDVRKHLGAPLLTIVREIEDKGPAKSSTLVWDKLATSPFTESYRVLRTALGYSWPESAHRVLAVTSTVPGEGKTTTAINLAAILATTGARVLIIDADMRRPQTHAVLKVRRQPGLSDLLVGKTTPAKAIQALAQPNIHYLPSGAPVPSPSDLLSASVLRALLDELRSDYTWVILDTPPVAPVADTLIMAPLTDGTIVVAGAEMTPHDAAAHTLERIRETGARILGIVLNRAVLPQRSYYGRYYGHYGYGYGYGEDGAPEKSRSGKVASIRRQSM